MSDVFTLTSFELMVNANKGRKCFLQLPKSDHDKVFNGLAEFRMLDQHYNSELPSVASLKFALYKRAHLILFYYKRTNLAKIQVKELDETIDELKKSIGV